ncbi:Vacuolar ATPase assembly integral membrane protein VMA21, partial [Zootermopsis nevadensis]
FQEQPDLQTFRTVFHYCIVIIVMPIASFFGAKSVIFDGVLGLTHVQSNVYSAIVTVVVLHIILGFYIHRAFSTDTSQKPAKQD